MLVIFGVFFTIVLCFLKSYQVTIMLFTIMKGDRIPLNVWIRIPVKKKCFRSKYLSYFVIYRNNFIPWFQTDQDPFFDIWIKLAFLRTKIWSIFTLLLWFLKVYRITIISSPGFPNGFGSPFYYIQIRSPINIPTVSRFKFRILFL